MKRTLLSGLAFAALLTTFGATANAHMITVPSKATISHAESATGAVTKVGWRVKRRHAKRYRSVRRARVHRGRGFRGPRRSSAAGIYVHPGITSMLIRRRQCLDALFPASDPACR